MALRWNAQAAEEASAAAERGVGTAMEYLLQQANQNVPLEEGTLERSGSAASEGTHGEVGYNTPYAARQHEELTWNHKGKGTAKWLEIAATAEGTRMTALVAAEVQRALS